MKLLAVCPRPEDGTAFYRVVSPLRILERQAPDIRVSILQGTAASFPQLAMSDVILIQRPTDESSVECMLQAQMLGRKVWIDYDDDYLDVPTHHRMFHHFGSPELRKTVRKCLELADCVTVSTHALQRKYAKINPRTVRVPNALDDLLIAPKPPFRLPRRTVLWRGGDSHERDLDVFERAIISASWRFEATWKWMGINPYRIMRALPEGAATAMPFIPLEKYFETAASIAASIVIVPLERSAFNDCKSNISLLEALWTGAVPLVPRWEEWDGVPGVAYYDDPASFERELIALGSAPLEELSARAAEGFAWVKANRLVSQANKVRALALQNMIESGPRRVETDTTSGGTLVKA